MDNNGEVGHDDTETAACEDEQVVTMMDVLKEQEDFEEDANAVLGASDDKNCTYSMGYIKRQAIYACMTCNSDAKDDPAQRAGVCLACSLKCHEDHELVELYTKRNFRCDCGNPKFRSHPCQFTPYKPDFNEENSYNQNFSGLYCFCQRPYPDPDVTEEDEMIQCIICEDWLHSAHLDATVPDNDQYAEMICKQCMETNKFLHNYGELIVNSEADVDISVAVISNSDANENINIIDTNDLSINKTENNTLENKDTHSPATVDDDVNKNDLNSSNQTDTSQHYDSIKISQDKDQTSLDNIVISVKDKIKDGSKNSLSPVHSLIIDQEQPHDEVENATGDTYIDPTLSTIDITGQEKSVENSIENNVNKAMMDSISNVKNIESTVSTTENSINCSLVDAIILNKNKSIQIKESLDPDEISDDKQIDTKENLLTETNMSKRHSEDTEHMKATESIELSNGESTKDVVEGCENPESKSSDELEEDRLLQDPVEPKNIIQGTTNNTETDDITTVEETETNIGTSQENHIPCDADPLYLKNSKNIDNSDEMMSAIDNNKDELPDLESIEKTARLSSEKMDTKLTIISDPVQECEKLEYKRKLSMDNQVNDFESKKLKLDSKPCSKPQNVKQRYKGATFWPAYFRQKLCTCNDCLSMYKDLSVLFLIDHEDTVSAYEHLGKEKTNGKPASEYEKGLAALSSLDRIQQINALTEYNKMRDKLLDFLKSFKERQEVVKEEDIKAFFAGMKPKRQPDGVYFCR